MNRRVDADTATSRSSWGHRGERGDQTTVTLGQRQGLDSGGERCQPVLLSLFIHPRTQRIRSFIICPNYSGAGKQEDVISYSWALMFPLTGLGVVRVQPSHKVVPALISIYSNSCPPLGELMCNSI